jgi:hypothetical protein
LRLGIDPRLQLGKFGFDREKLALQIFYAQPPSS